MLSRFAIAPSSRSAREVAGSAYRRLTSLFAAIHPEGNIMSCWMVMTIFMITYDVSGEPTCDHAQELDILDSLDSTMGGELERPNQNASPAIKRFPALDSLEVLTCGTVGGEGRDWDPRCGQLPFLATFQIGWLPFRHPPLRLLRHAFLLPSGGSL